MERQPIGTGRRQLMTHVFTKACTVCTVDLLRLELQAPHMAVERTVA
jgi:hypothetical protein